MYTVTNFKTKKAFKLAVQQYLEDKAAGREAFPVTLYSPGLEDPKTEGMETVEGPHYPAHHSWCAKALMKDGIVVKVK